jgi:hypothetical protein
VLRYEDVVAAPDEARAALGRHLGVEHAVPSLAQGPIRVAPDREAWKARATGPVTTERSAAWTSELAPDVTALVEAVCRTGMRRWGYDAGGDGRLALVRLAPGRQARRLYFRWARARRMRRIRRTPLA